MQKALLHGLRTFGVGGLSKYVLIGKWVGYSKQLDRRRIIGDIRFSIVSSAVTCSFNFDHLRLAAIYIHPVMLACRDDFYC